ncbi:MAG TPA: 50S ribosomal protein L21 [Candidatus Limnocylindria bacterium]|nr:50S ribosomal protein L21 [Candidatus Limnocylindria bacterium]
MAVREGLGGGIGPRASFEGAQTLYFSYVARAVRRLFLFGWSHSVYAVVRSGGKQYRVEEGSVLSVGKVPGNAGDTITLDQILFVADGEAIKAGPAALKGARITAEIVGHSKGPKIEVLRYKNKTRQRKARGHRQDETTLRIKKFEGLR